MAVFCFSMPDSPEEPVEIIPPRFPQQEPRSIPVSRPGLSPAQPFLELIPRGPLPDELQSPPGAAPPTVAVSNLPVSFPKTVTISASQQSPASTQSPKGAGNLSPRDSLQPSSPANDLISRLLAVTAPDKLSSSHGTYPVTLKRAHAPNIIALMDHLSDCLQIFFVLGTASHTHASQVKHLGIIAKRTCIRDAWSWSVPRNILPVW